MFDALLGFNGDKLPRPNALFIAFWQFSWKFVKDEVMGFFRDFHEHSSFDKSLNAIFLVLIPKKKTKKQKNKKKTKDLMDFKPISLVGGLYK